MMLPKIICLQTGQDGLSLLVVNSAYITYLANLVSQLVTSTDISHTLIIIFVLELIMNGMVATI